MKLTQDPAVLPEGLRSNTEEQMLDLGARAVSGDGREYRYIKAGAVATVAGKVFDGPANNTDNANLAVPSAVTIGETEITVTLGSSAVTANEFAGGVVVINDVAGEGFTYTIKSHPVAIASASLVLTLEKDEGVAVALTTSSQATLIANQYNGVILHAASETGIPVGVATSVITAGNYGWIQTRGAIGVFCDASPAALGQQVDASTTTIGAVTLGTVATASIGYALGQGVSTEYNPVFLTM